MDSQNVSHTKSAECVECEEFEMTKKYSGRAGTPGQEEYDRIDIPNECPVCEADLVVTLE